MSLNINFKQNLLEEYKKSILILKKSSQYDEIFTKIKSIIKNINLKLDLENIIMKDLNTFIDKTTKTKINNYHLDSIFNNEIKEIEKLNIELNKFGWKDDLSRCIDVILTCTKYQEIEKEIYNTYDKEESKEIIYQIKKELVQFEKDLNINIFTKDVEKIDYLNSFKILYPKDHLVITKTNNIEEENLYFFNDNGEVFYFKKTSQIIEDNNIYFCITKTVDKNDDENQFEYYLYRLDKKENKQILIMIEDVEIYNKIFDKEERLITDYLIKKNRNKI